MWGTTSFISQKKERKKKQVLIMEKAIRIEYYNKYWRACINIGRYGANQNFKRLLLLTKTTISPCKGATRHLNQKICYKLQPMALRFFSLATLLFLSTPDMFYDKLSLKPDNRHNVKRSPHIRRERLEVMKLIEKYTVEFYDDLTV